MKVGLFLKYDREVRKWSENREITDLWGRADRYAVISRTNDLGGGCVHGRVRGQGLRLGQGQRV